MANILKSDFLYETLRERILSGVYSCGNSLPREVDLSQEFGVARNTLRRALGELEKEGLIRRVKSKGTFVRGRKGRKSKYLLILNEGGGIENPYQYIVPYLQIAAEVTGIGLEIACRNFFQSLSVSRGAESIRSAGVEGAIVLANNMLPEDPLHAILKESGVPVLLPHGGKWDHEMTGFGVLRIDFAKSLRDALLYLSGLGHRRIAVLAKEPGESGEAWNRALQKAGFLREEREFIAVREYSREAYFAMLRELGLSDDPVLLQFSRGTPQEIRRSVESLIQLQEPPTALIGFSDFYAMYAMQELKLLGIRIPEEISALGLCGYPGGAYLSPTLTTIGYNYEKIGWKCLELMPRLIRIAREGGEMPDVIMEHRLIERNSTAFRKE